ncbi:9874_t:CDS:2 [Ambispora leptoticha]|uniref:9874_t:CDS:1 n=1 Tax=Ambispora leptoticha TaxID=144679 RepID=A0A9N9FQC0_9GLOM|nr:9874_t:CDS:2 [Ambispora leptoticha]
MAEGTDCRVCGAFQNEGGIDTLRSYGKNSIPRQVSTDTNHYVLRCLESPLELRTSALKEDDSRGTNQISIRESGSLSTEYNDNTARSNIASENSELHILKSSIETERQRCEIHVDSLSAISDNGGSKYKDGENTDITLGKEYEGCPNTETIGKMQASFGKLLRVGSLRGDGWKKIVPRKTCQLVHADARFTSKGKSIAENPTTMSQVQLFDAFKDNSRIATLVDYEVLDSDPKELIYHIRCVAGFGFDHIIIIGETDYGIIFLDCYGRVFLWENESQMLWPLGNSPEEASKGLVKGDQLRWFEENGTVYEAMLGFWESNYCNRFLSRRSQFEDSENERNSELVDEWI